MKRDELRRQVDALVDYIHAKQLSASAAMEEVANHLVNQVAPDRAREVYESREIDSPVLAELLRVAETSIGLSPVTLERLFWVGIYNEVHAGEAWRQVSLSKKYALIDLRDRTKLSEGVRLAVRGKFPIRELAQWVSRQNKAAGGGRGPRIGSRNVTQMVRVGSLLDERDRLDRLVASMAELPKNELDEIEAGLEKTAAGAKKLLAALRKKRRG